MTSTSEEVLSFGQRAFEIQQEMNDKFAKLDKKFSKLIYVYNPTDYASDFYGAYLKKYLNGPKKTLFLGINPGPWGMCQTGIPFACSTTVRDRFPDLLTAGTVRQPTRTHEKRKVTGLECTKIEQSGLRLWRLFDKFYTNSDEFFIDNFILNYCALTFYDDKGQYLSTSKWQPETRRDVRQICDEGLAKLIDLIQPTTIICISAYMNDQVKRVQKKTPKFLSIKRICMQHPSPRAWRSEETWFEVAKEQLIKHGWNLINGQTKVDIVPN